MNKISVLLLFLFTLTLFSCSNYSKISTVNVAQAYSPEKSSLHPKYFVTHPDEKYSLVNFEIPSSELLYIQKAPDAYYAARYNVNIRIFEASNDKILVFKVDSIFTDTLQNDHLRKIRKSLLFPLEMGNEYILHIRFEDSQNRRSVDEIISTDKKSIYSRGFFSFTNENNGKNFQNPFEISTKRMISLNHSTNKDFTVLVRKINFPVQPAPLPFANQNANYSITNNWEAETTFTILFDSNGTARFELPQYGLYHFADPGNPKNGFLAMNFWAGFPELPNDDTRLKPLRYITTQQEFENLFTFDEPTLAMERFWTKVTGNPDRANSVKERYNQRVVDANKHFSSFLPGWQTDRGMIYIVFGPPDKVHLKTDGENWQYYEQINLPALHFEFIKHNHPYSANNLVLKRNLKYKNSWNIALERWRR